MPKINTKSILSKLSAATKSEGFIARNKGAITGVTKEKAEEAGDKLVDCINNAISSNFSSSGAIAAIGSIDRSPAVEESVSAGVCVYHIDVTVEQQSRPSLYPKKYGEGAYDMAGLLDHGYSTGHAVYGEWHGDYIFGLRSRPATRFVAQGVDDFNNSYGATYNAQATVSGGRFLG